MRIPLRSLYNTRQNTPITMYVQVEGRHEPFYDVVPFPVQVITKTALKCRDIFE